MKLKRILTITYSEPVEPYKNNITCPYCGKSEIEFKEDNYPKGETKQCPECGKHITIRTVFTNMPVYD